MSDFEIKNEDSTMRVYDAKNSSFDNFSASSSVYQTGAVTTLFFDTDVKMDWSIVKSGNIVTLTWDLISGDQATNNRRMEVYQVIPEIYRPSSGVYGTYVSAIDSTLAISVIAIFSDGTIRFTNGADTDFPTATNTIWALPGSISWVI